MFDYDKLRLESKSISAKSFNRRLDFLKNQGIETEHIKKTVDSASDNLNNGKRSFVIYGEPQSGKTEMMIALTARLLDEGFKYIVVLMNDSLVLRDQNLSRFKEAGLLTVPVLTKELSDKSVDIQSQSRVIFSKKNNSDLKKLNELVRSLNDVVVIDDEADYATPNNKVNKNEVSKINELTGKLIDKGIYIGVTATPARLDLNYTHLNESEYWIDYPTHSNYTGQEIFFPNDINKTRKFRLELLPDDGDDPKFLRDAVFSFLINSSYLNSTKERSNYSMLIHTSGIKIDHTKDYEDVNKILKIISDTQNIKNEIYFKEIWNKANDRFPGDADTIVKFMMANNQSFKLTIMNSDHDKSQGDVTSSPPSPFTIIIGGNSISRGVTFNNLISMFFTRDAKHKLQQDTYIQRARMFGARGKVLEFFELYIPQKLYADWRRAFIFHRLSLASRKNGNGIPIWHEGMRIKVAANNSIDTSRVTIDSGEMSFNKFNFIKEISLIINSNNSDMKKISLLREVLPKDSFPKYIEDFIISFSNNNEDMVIIHEPRSIMNMDPKYANSDEISRARGLIAGQDLISKHKPDASHHIFVFYNDQGIARIVYKFNENVSFIKGRV